MKGTKLIIYLISVITYAVLLAVVFERPISFSVNSSFSVVGLGLELFGLAMFVCLVFLFLREHSRYDALAFFVPVMFIGVIVEGGLDYKRGIYFS